MAKKKKQNKRRDLRIIWQSNGPHVPSGYGVFTKDWLMRARADGWNVACISFSGLDAGSLDWNGVKLYPKMTDPYGSDALMYHSIDFGADVSFTMQDTPLLHEQHLSNVKRWIPYTPIHYRPVSPFVLNKLKYAYKIITFANYGKEGLAQKGFSSTMIPEGLDVNVFKPMDRKELRAKLNIPEDMFLFGMVGANKEIPTRKGFQEALDAFKMFLINNPDVKAGLYVHTLSPPFGKFPIMHYANEIGIKDNVFVPDNYHALFKSPHEVMAKLFNVFDVLLQPSRTEGFGLPVIEAQASGVPVIATNFSAMPELIVEGETGLLSKVQRYEFSTQYGYWAVPDTDDLYKQMEKIYKMIQKDGEKMSKRARKHIVDNYNIDTIFKEKWIPLLEELQEEILGPIDKEDNKGKN